jgi:hypothetical protein
MGALLESRDRADVLSALTFLGGRHLAEAQRQFVPETQESKYAALFTRLLASRRIAELIHHLRDSGDKWVSEAAALAARGPRERPLY